jgi:hypothetical protein
MGMFSKILDKIFHRQAPAAAPQAPPINPTSPTLSPTPVPTAPTAPVDVEAVLTDLAAAKGGGGNWRTSIVDLLKLLDLDSSLAARKELAEDLKVHVGEHGSAEQNIALQKAVWKALADNGGHVPANLKD